VIVKKLGNTGHLFGAVTKEEISDALRAQHNIEIDKKELDAKHGIKTTGLHDLGSQTRARYPRNTPFRNQR
jgi:large subunit ribosomal protein L9